MISRDPHTRAFPWLIHGSMVDELNKMSKNSVHAIVCDPPYEIAFHGNQWDKEGVSFQAETWKAALRVLRPGGHALIFGSPRTFHRIAVAAEDAGFEMVDTLMWVQHQGFPKTGSNIAKAIDRTLGKSPKVLRRVHNSGYRRLAASETASLIPGGGLSKKDAHKRNFGTVMERWTQCNQQGLIEGVEITEGASEEAREFQGWTHALKPAVEPILCLRKPMGKRTVAENLIKHRTGAFNTEGCRLSVQPGEPGRWPSTLLLSHLSLCKLIGTHTTLTTESSVLDRAADPRKKVVTVETWDCVEGCPVKVLNQQYVDSPTESERIKHEGGISRLFLCAKATKDERSFGLEVLSNDRPNVHVTVKPISVMRWLCRLVTPINGIVLDPFMGSGTTGIACAFEGFRFIGVEKEKAHVDISERRISAWSTRITNQGDTKRHRKLTSF